MSRPKNKDEFRQELANNFIKVLEEDGLTWTKEWATNSSDAPANAVTGACYRGVNAFNLRMIAYLRGYEDNRWATMIQIMDKFGKYHKGEKWHLQKGSVATYVEYWFPYDLVEKRVLTWSEHEAALKAGRASTEFTMHARYTAVFNASCIDGISPMPEIEKKDIDAARLVKAVSCGMGVDILNDGGDSAFYRPSEDKVHLPEPGAFVSEYAYNATALHELAHATGHSSRLNRDFLNHFGSESYAYEELVAEMASAFMGVDLGADEAHVNNHKAYIQSWASQIKESPRQLVSAVKDAYAATEYMETAAVLKPEQEIERRSANAALIPSCTVMDELPRRDAPAPALEPVVTVVRSSVPELGRGQMLSLSCADELVRQLGEVYGEDAFQSVTLKINYLLLGSMRSLEEDIYLSDGKGIVEHIEQNHASFLCDEDYANLAVSAGNLGTYKQERRMSEDVLRELVPYFSEHIAISRNLSALEAAREEAADMSEIDRITKQLDAVKLSRSKLNAYGVPEELQPTRQLVVSLPQEEVVQTITQTIQFS